ncbi:MAG: ketopantoate reductase family protein [Firmicutes bacterium]|nr:ketopantoate reductase family protein [[Eubacterium] siraeum]MCM1487498.1 ketopantoate reductase family protein [Bacillota bacterium]
MNVLVYGAGAIGSLLIHFLVKSGNKVTVVSGRNYDSLCKNGIVIRHYLQKKTTVDKVNVVKEPDKSIHYDAVFSVMQSQQQRAVADDLAALNTEVVVLVGNNTEADELEKYILEKSPTKCVLFGFQNSAGHRENGITVCGRLPVTELVIGGLHAPANDEDKRLISSLFSAKGYKTTWLDDMYGYYLCHMAEIMPYAFLSFELNHELKKASHKDIKRVMRASNEMFEYLKSIGVNIMPPKEDEFYGNGFKSKAMFLLYFIMSRTVLGELMLTDHCKNGADEMRIIDEFVQELRTEKPGKAMPMWDSMRKSLRK